MVPVLRLPPSSTLLSFIHSLTCSFNTYSFAHSLILVLTNQWLPASSPSGGPGSVHISHRPWGQVLTSSLRGAERPHSCSAKAGSGGAGSVSPGTQPWCGSEALLSPPPTLQPSAGSGRRRVGGACELIAEGAGSWQAGGVKARCSPWGVLALFYFPPFKQLD